MVGLPPSEARARTEGKHFECHLELFATPATDGFFRSQSVARLQALKNLCMPSFTKEDVAAHKTKNDLWIILRGKVYDASKFRLNHPGGSKPLQKEAGKVSEAIARELRAARSLPQMLSQPT